MADLFGNYKIDDVSEEGTIEIPQEIIGGEPAEPKPGAEPGAGAGTQTAEEKAAALAAIEKAKGDGNFIDIPEEIISGKTGGKGSAEGGAGGEAGQGSSPFSTLAEAFVTSGYLPSESLEHFETLSKEDGMEKFMELYEEHRIDSDTKILTEEQKEYLAMLKDGVKQSDIQAYQSKIHSVNQFTDELLKADSDAGKQARYTMLVSDLMNNKSMNQEEAKEFALLMMEKDNSVDKAIAARDAVKGHLESIMQKERDKSKTDIQKKLDDNKNNLEKIKKTLFEDKKLFDGKVKLTDKMAQRVYNAVTTIAGESKNGTPQNAVITALEKDPIKMLPRLGYVWVMTNGLEDFSGFNAKAMTAATHALEEIAGKPSIKGTFDPASQAQADSVRASGEEMVRSLRALGL